MKNLQKSIRFSATFLMLCILMSAGTLSITPASADSVINVNTIVDEDTNNADCSLREAIIAANTNAAYNGCPAGTGADTIMVPAGTYELSSQLPPMDTVINIKGDTAENTILEAVAPGIDTFRLFLVWSGGGDLRLENLTLENGRCAGACSTYPSRGGAIYNEGILTLTNVNVHGNTATDSGGAIFHSGSSLVITNSTFDANTATTYGGAFVAQGSVTITNSTFSENDASNGGGIFVSSDTTVITNSTFSGNTTGGAVAVPTGGTVIISNSTFDNNGAGVAGGGLWVGAGGVANLYNSIIANSTSGGDCAAAGGLTANNYNLDSDGTCANATTKTSAELNLGPLTDNGGPTQTIALLPGSHALDTGDNTVCAGAPVNNLDQRGNPRPVDSDVNGSSICDVGAFEYQHTLTTNNIKSNKSHDGWILESSETSNKGGTKNNTAKIINLGDDAVDRQYRAVLSFNTGNLPDSAIITKVTLKVKRAGVIGGGNPIKLFRGIFAEIKSGSFGTPSLANSDFQTVADKKAGPFKPALKSGWYSLNLSTGSDFINKLGYTQIKLRFKLDDNNNNAGNMLYIYSGNASTASRPQLIIEYYVP